MMPLHMTKLKKLAIFGLNKFEFLMEPMNLMLSKHYHKVEYRKRNYFKKKNILITFVLCGFFCSYQNADANQGFYMGGQVGDGKLDYGDIFSSSQHILPEHHSSEDGITERIYLGYQINDYFGAETGYTLFSDNTYKAKNSLNSYYSTLTIKTDMWDILGTIGAPLKKTGFRGDIKFGAADVASKGHLSSNVFGSSTAQEDNWNPVAGMSFSYSVDQYFSVDISYLHVFGSPDISKNLHANIDLATLGIKFLLH